MNWIRNTTALLVVFSLYGCGMSTPSGPKKVGQVFKVTASCGTLTWYPAHCMDTFDDDQRQLVAAAELTCSMGNGRSISPYSVHGQVNPGKTSGEPEFNGLWIKPSKVIYRCGFARVTTHEITCHAWKMGKQCKNPH